MQTPRLTPRELELPEQVRTPATDRARPYRAPRLEVAATRNCRSVDRRSQSMPSTFDLPPSLGPRPLALPPSPFAILSLAALAWRDG